jgi:lysozyme
MKVATLVATLLLIGGCSSLGWLGTLSDVSINTSSVKVESLETMLIRHEGYRQFPYDDRGGVAIGYGTNLSKRGLSREEALYLMRNDINRLRNALSKRVEGWIRLDQARRDVLVSLGYNLGLNGVLSFKRMLAAIEEENYELAATEMYLSDWCEQVGKRCPELAEIMWHGKVN